jgi:hypothetical protein
MCNLRRNFAVLFTGAALILPVVGAQAASAQQQTQTGLVNVWAENILSGNKIVLLQNVSIGVAAAFCNINVNVLSAQLSNNQRGSCPAKTNSIQKAWVTFRR